MNGTQLIWLFDGIVVTWFVAEYGTSDFLNLIFCLLFWVAVLTIYASEESMMFWKKKAGVLS